MTSRTARRNPTADTHSPARGGSRRMKTRDRTSRTNGGSGGNVGACPGCRQPEEPGGAKARNAIRNFEGPDAATCFSQDAAETILRKSCSSSGVDARSTTTVAGIGAHRKAPDVENPSILRGLALMDKGCPHAAHALRACCPPRGLPRLGAARRRGGCSCVESGPRAESGSPHAAHALRACCPPRGLPRLGAARRRGGCSCVESGPRAECGSPHAAHALRACCPPGGLPRLGSGPAAGRLFLRRKWATRCGGSPHAAHALRACCPPRGLPRLGSGPAAGRLFLLRGGHALRVGAPTRRTLCALAAPRGLPRLGAAWRRGGCFAWG